MNDITGETPASFEPTIDYVVTKVPRWAFEKLPGASPVPRHADAVGRRGDGDRAHVPRVAPEGAALARDGPRRPQRRPGRARVRRARRRRARAPGRDAHARAAVPARGRAAARRRRSSGCTRPPGSTRGSSTRSLELVRDARASSRRRGADDLDRARLAAGQAARLLRRAARVPLGRRRGARCTRRASPPASQVTYKTVDTCAAEFAARTPYHYGTYEDEDEVAPLDAAGGRDPRQRAEPHRPGRRVRLLLRARRVRAVRRGLRDRDGQLQPRDRLHRLRHQRPTLLRAAHARGRARGVPPPAGALERRRRLGGRDRRASAGRRR